MATYILAGISFPFRLQGGGLPYQAKGIDVIKSSLLALMKKRKRSSVMNPTLGVGLQDLIFENTGPVLRSKISRDIATNVAEFLPQVKILDIKITEQNTLVTVEVIYAVQGVTDTTNAINFPR